MITASVILFIIVLYIFLAHKLLTEEHPALFKRAVKSYQKADKINSPESGSLICTGSSVMKYWKNCKEDLSPLFVYNRAIAGTKINEITYWLDDLVLKYNPAAVLIYAGSNDIQGWKPKKAEELYNNYINLVEKCLKYNPGLKIFFISILPAPSFLRWKHWNEIQKANHLIEEYCLLNDSLFYIDLTGDFLSADNKPERSLYKYDLIHLRDEGYKKWTARIKPVLVENLKEQK